MQTKAGGLAGIKSIHTRVAKGSRPAGKRDVFHEPDTLQDKRGSIDGAYSNQEDVLGMDVSAEQKLMPRRNGGHG
jgi:hypothetical protein